MAENTVKVRIKHAVKTTADWEKSNPVLLSGEVAYDSTLKRTKTGDGTHTWSQLPYDDELLQNRVGELEKTEIGGRNLLLHTGDLTKWTKESGVSVVKDSDGWFKVVDYSHNSSRWGIYFNLANYEQNTDYTLSVDVKYGNAKIEVSQGFGGFGSNNQAIESGSKRIKMTFNTGSHTAFIRVYLNIYPTAANQYGYFKLPKLEKGNKATDWTPAPEDLVSDWNESDISSYSYIKNKPILGTMAAESKDDYSSTGHTHDYLPLSGGTVTGATQFNNYLKLNAWSGYGTGTANFWYDANNKFVEIENATDLKLAGTKVSKEGHTHNYAGSSSSGGSATSAVKLDSSAGSLTQPIYFKDGKPVVCTYSLGKSVPNDAVFTDTHYTSGTIINNSATATVNTTSTITNGNVYLNHIENGILRNSHKISGSGATTVTSDASGNIVISSTNTKNSAGSTNTSSKIYLIGATSQSTNPTTYSHDTAFVGTDGCLYSNNTKVSVDGHSHALPWALFRIETSQSSGSSIYIQWGNTNNLSPIYGDKGITSSNFILDGSDTRSFINCPRTGYIRITVNLAVKASSEINDCYLLINEYRGADNWKDERICLGNIKTTYTTVSGSTIVHVTSGSYLQLKLTSASNTTPLSADYSNPYYPHVILEYIS